VNHRQDIRVSTVCVWYVFNHVRRGNRKTDLWFCGGTRTAYRTFTGHVDLPVLRRKGEVLYFIRGFPERGTISQPAAGWTATNAGSSGLTPYKHALMRTGPLLCPVHCDSNIYCVLLLLTARLLRCPCLRILPCGDKMKMKSWNRYTVVCSYHTSSHSCKIKTSFIIQFPSLSLSKVTKNTRWYGDLIKESA